MNTVVSKNEEHFAKYLPENMTWEQFDSLVENAISSIAIMQLMEKNYLGPWVSKIEVEWHLLGQGYSQDTSKFATLVSWTRLIHTKKVVTTGQKIGLPKVRPV